jgi:hypothetical protein
MNAAEKINTLLHTKAAEILTTNEFASGRNYETNVGGALQTWLGQDIDDNEDADLEETERLEIREIEGEGVDNQDPVGKDRVTFEFAYFKKLNTSDISATVKPEIYLRKVQTDIYRMIGANYAYFRTNLNAGLIFKRGKWTRNVQTLEKVYLEQSIEIIAEYTTTDIWQINESEYS